MTRIDVGQDGEHESGFSRTCIGNTDVVCMHYVPDVTVGTHGFPLTITPEMEIADSGRGLVHTRKRVGQDADVVVKCDFNVEDVVVIDGAHQFHHLDGFPSFR